MFIKYFKKDYELFDFLHFVSKEKLEYNLDYVKNMVEEK